MARLTIGLATSTFRWEDSDIPSIEMVIMNLQNGLTRSAKNSISLPLLAVSLSRKQWSMPGLVTRDGVGGKMNYNPCQIAAMIILEVWGRH